jgi:hypothetical protein
MLNGALVAPVSPELVAAKRYPVPALSMDRSLNVATPATAAAVTVPERVPRRDSSRSLSSPRRCC